MGRLCGLSTVVTPAGASINVSKDIFSRKQYKGVDDDDDDGLYLSPLSDMSPATSDCLEPYFSGGGVLFFSDYRVCVDFSGYFYLFLIFYKVYPFWVVSV